MTTPNNTPIAPLNPVTLFMNGNFDAMGNGLPLLVTQIPIPDEAGNLVYQDLQMSGLERRRIRGFDLRKTLLPPGRGYPSPVPLPGSPTPSNFWTLTGAQDWEAKGFGASITIDPAFPTLLRIDIPGAGIPAPQLAEIILLATAGLGADIFFTGCERDGNCGQFPIAPAGAVPGLPAPVANLVYCFADLAFSGPDPNNGLISWGVLRFTVADSNNVAVPVLLNAQPDVDTTVPGNNSLTIDQPDQVPDTWARVQSYDVPPKHSLVMDSVVAPDGTEEVLIAFGTEAPLCDPIGSSGKTTWLYDTQKRKLRQTGNLVMVGFDANWFRTPPGPNPFNNRVTIVGGFNDNATLLTPACIIQSYDRATETWYSGWKTALSIPPVVVNPPGAGNGIWSLPAGLSTIGPLDTSAAFFGNTAGAIIPAMSYDGLFVEGSMTLGPFPGFNSFTQFSGLFLQRIPQAPINQVAPVIPPAPPGFPPTPGVWSYQTASNTIVVRMAAPDKVVFSLTCRRNADPMPTQNNPDKLSIPRALFGGLGKLPSGKILICGGFASTGDPGIALFFPATNICETFDPATGATAVLPPLSNMITGVLSEPPCVVSGPDGRVYCFGGVISFNGVFSPQVQIFDETTMTWTLGTPLPTGPLGRATVVPLPNGTFLLYGGVTSIFPNPYIANPRTFIYDPAAEGTPGGPWEEVGPMVQPIGGGFGYADTNGNVYQVGGFRGFVTQDDKSLNRVVQRWNKQTKNWERLRDIPNDIGVQWYRMKLTSLNQFFIFGGIALQQRNNFNLMPCNTAALYSPV